MKDPYFFIKNYIPFKQGVDDYVNLRKNKNPYRRHSLEFDLYEDGFESKGDF